jgi:hypothetical protein
VDDPYRFTLGGTVEVGGAEKAELADKLGTEVADKAEVADKLEIGVRGREGGTVGASAVSDSFTISILNAMSLSCVSSVTAAADPVEAAPEMGSKLIGSGPDDRPIDSSRVGPLLDETFEESVGVSNGVALGG